MANQYPLAVTAATGSAAEIKTFRRKVIKLGLLLANQSPPTGYLALAADLIARSRQGTLKRRNTRLAAASAALIVAANQLDYPWSWLFNPAEPQPACRVSRRRVAWFLEKCGRSKRVIHAVRIERPRRVRTIFVNQSGIDKNPVIFIDRAIFL